LGTILTFNRVKEKQEKGTGSIVRKSGSKKLYVDFHYFGKRIEKSTGLDDTPVNRLRAREWLDRQHERIADGTFKFAEAFPGAPDGEKRFYTEKEGWEYSPEPRRVMFGDYVKKWREEILDHYPSANKKRDYNQAIDDRLLLYFADKTFHQITGVELQKFIAALKWRSGDRIGETLSRSRVRNILAPLRAIWSDACEEHRWDLADPFRFVAKHMPKGSKKHPEVFRFEEWHRLINAIDPFFRPVAEVMVMTGMIGSEVAGLRREHIQGDHIIIQNSIVRKCEKDDLKNDFRKRKLPITACLRDQLDIALSRATGEYVFTMKSGRTFDVDSFRKNPWSTALKKAGLSYRVPYSTRHTFAAWSLTVGMNPNKLVKLMGHSSKKMVYEVYGNYVEGLEKDVGTISEYFGNDFDSL
jgi:integrase